MWNECGDVKRERSGGEDWHVKRIRNSSLNSRLINLFSLLLLCGLRFSECWNTSFVGVVQISFRDPLCWKIKGCIENPIFNARSWSLAALHSARQGSFLNSMKAPPWGGGVTHVRNRFDSKAVCVALCNCRIWSSKFKPGLVGATVLFKSVIIDSGQRGPTSLFLHLWVSNGFLFAICLIHISLSMAQQDCTPHFYKWEAVQWGKL